MLARASVGEVKNGNVSKAQGAYLVVAMRVYPRFLPKLLTDEYLPSLSPQPELFQRYRELKKKSGDQNDSFERAGYQSLFGLAEEGMRELARLAKLSSQRDVYLICQCDRAERCHVDLMLLIAEKQFGARIAKLPFSYAEFRKRI